VIATRAPLRRVARDELAYRNLLSVRRRPIAFDWMGATWGVSLEPLMRAPRPTCFTLEAQWGGARLIVRVDRGCVDGVLQATLQCPVLPMTPAPLRRAMLEAVLSEPCLRLQQATRRSLQMVSEGGGDAHADLGDLAGFACRLENEDDILVAEIWVDADGLGFLSEAIRGAAPAAASEEALADLPMPIRLAVGWVDLTHGALGRLAVHDVILLDECWVQGQDELTLVVGRSHALRCAWAGTTLEVKGHWEHIMVDGMETHVEPELDGSDLADDDETDDPVALDDVPVRVSFDLGTRVVTLGELRAIAPGYTFDLGRELRRAVIVRANGKAIGEGELVDVDGRVGVVVTVLACGKP
jgi:type III secretion protein Q